MWAKESCVMQEAQDANALLAQATSLHQQGDLNVAVPLYQRVLAINPDHSEALMLLGVIAYQKKQYPLAEELLRKSLSINDQSAPCWCNYGSLLQDTGRLDKAIWAFKKAIALQPEFPEAYANAANVHASRGQLEKAVFCYQKALEIRPDFLDARLNLGISFREMGRYELAEQCFQKAIKLFPQSAEAAHNLGSLYAEMGRLKEAYTLFNRSIELKPDYAEAYSNLGSLYIEMGEHEKAMECFDKAPTYSPQFHIAESNKIFAMHYDPTVSSEALYEAALAWGRNHAPRELMHPPETDKQPERALRIGYVSADLRAHPVGIFMESVLANHTGESEIFCYANMPHEDHQTLHIKPSVKHWRRIFGMSDDEVERIIREDKIDILVDLSGHTAANRLKVFAAKPAPVQITWIGYFDTTGMEAMDYIICDDQVLPAASERWFTEKPLRMPETYLCFTPPLYDIPATSAFETNGHITFGCFNRLNKLTPEVLASWAEILKAVPGSRLFLKSKAFAETATSDGMRKLFEELGIAGERLRLEGASLRRDYLASYNQVDIVLDPFPYGGGTTTAEALWMGRPVITWPQERFISRLSSSLLHAMGRKEWIAATRQEYVEKAAGLARDTKTLAQAHQHGRQVFMDSKACDAKSFVRDLENLYRKAWRAYCEK